MPITNIAKYLKSDYYQVLKKVKELGLDYQTDRWSKKEELLLIELSQKYYIKEIAKILNRTEAAVATKARNMGLSIITLKREYTKDELNYIKTNWGVIPVSEMARQLNVSRIMIENQAQQMNLPKLGNNPYRKWTGSKIEKLRTLAKKKTITQLAEYFKTTNAAIITIAHKNNISLIDDKIHWTEKDNKILREYAKTCDLGEIAALMDRTTSSVRLQAQRLGITIQPNKEHEESIWTEDNTEELIKLIKEDKSLLEIAKEMHKKDQTILKKAKELSLEIKKESYKPWTIEEQNRLIELSKTKKLSELVRELERTSISIKSQAKKLGITIINDRRNWTQEEYELLEKLVMVDKKTPREIANILNRSEESVVIKINRRGLKVQTNDKKFWTTEEEQILSDLWGNKPIEYIAKKLERTVSSLKNKAYQLGLGSQLDNNYDGLKISEIAKLFNVRLELVNIYWISLGLKYSVRKVSRTKSYKYVTIKDLYDFLEQNQNIWDSRYLEKNILGIEPDWLKEKRKKDSDKPQDYFGLDRLTKQQLIQTKKYIADNYLDKDVIKEKTKKRGTN